MKSYTEADKEQGLDQFARSSGQVLASVGQTNLSFSTGLAVHGFSRFGARAAGREPVNTDLRARGHGGLWQ